MPEDAKHWLPALKPVAEKCGLSVFEETSRDMKAAFEAQISENTDQHLLPDISTFNADATPVLAWGRDMNPIIHAANDERANPPRGMYDRSADA